MHNKIYIVQQYPLCLFIPFDIICIKSCNPLQPQFDFIRNRLKTEIFNQAFGVEKGDEVEAQRDVQILKALEAIGGAG